MGKFPWMELIQTVAPILLGYFTGRYRAVVKKDGNKE